MVDFRSGYVPPGVYVTADNSAASSSVGISPTVVCLVGPGLGYQSFSETIVFPNSTSTLTLTQLGIQQNSIVVKSATGTTFVKDTDYSINSTNGSRPDTSTTISIIGAGSILPNSNVVVSYNYANANYFALNQFSDFQSFINVYGNPFNPDTGVLQSPLSLAAQLAFENGSNNIYAVTLDGLGSLSDQYNNAYVLTSTDFNINIIVPIFAEGTIADDTVFTNFSSGLAQHLQSTDSAGLPRVSLVGLPTDFSSSVTPDVLSSILSYRRIALIWPNQFRYYNSILNTTVNIGGSYAAAAAAGLLANQPMNQGLTRRQLRSISAVSRTALLSLSTSNKNFWSSRGVAVIEPNRQNQLVIRHGVTTDMSSVITRELSIVRCQDSLFNIVQLSLDQAQLIGTPITSSTPLAVKGILTGALETALGSNTIQGYANVAVRQQSLPNGDPTVIECTFSYQPTYPLNYITVNFTLDLNTGDISTSTDTTS